MEKTNVNTALAIVFVASAGMLIGGLAVTTLTTTAMVDQPDFIYCAGPRGGLSVCDSSQEDCEEVRERLGIKGHCHKKNPDALK